MRAEQTEILLDQNIPYETTEWLRKFLPETPTGHAFDHGMAGWADRDVFEFAQGRSALIISYDEDFADQRLFPVGDHFGIIRLRIEPTTAEETIAALERVFSTLRPEDLRGKLVIVQRNRIRIIPE